MSTFMKIDKMFGFVGRTNTSISDTIFYLLNDVSTVNAQLIF